MKYLYSFTVFTILIVVFLLCACNDSAREVFGAVDPDIKRVAEGMRGVAINQDDWKARVQQVVNNRKPPVPEYKLEDEYTRIQVCVSGISQRAQKLQIWRYALCHKTDGCDKCLSVTCNYGPDKGTSTMWMDHPKDTGMSVCDTFVASQGDTFRLINVADKEFTKLKDERWSVLRIFPGRSKIGKTLGNPVLVDNNGNIVK